MASPVQQDITPADVPTSVYRYYDREGVLLYVGVTSTGMLRNRQHNASKEWWQMVVSQKVEHHPSRPLALKRERDLIRQYRPPFNRQHNPEHAQIAAAYRVAAKAGVLGLMRRYAVQEKGFHIARTISYEQGVARWEATGDGARSLKGVSYDKTHRAPVFIGTVLHGHVCGIEHVSDDCVIVAARIKTGCDDIDRYDAFMKFVSRNRVMAIKKIELLKAAGARPQ